MRQAIQQVDTDCNFPSAGPPFRNVRNGDRRVSVDEVWIVASSADSDPEAEVGDTIEHDGVVTPIRSCRHSTASHPLHQWTQKRRENRRMLLDEYVLLLLPLLVRENGDQIGI